MRKIRIVAVNGLGAWMALTACSLQPNSQTTEPLVLDTGEPGSSSETTTASSTGAADDSSSSGAGEDTTSGEPDDTAASSTGAADLCGNGVVDPGESCDGAVDINCAEKSAIYTAGTVVCGPDCQLDFGGCQTCEAPTLSPCDANSGEPLHALELGCDTLEQGWDATNSVPLLSSKLVSPDTTAFRTVRRFGNHPTAWTPRAGASARALLVSTGGFAPADENGVVLMTPGSAQDSKFNNNINPDSKGELPPGMRIKLENGNLGDLPFSECDDVHDCSNTLAGQWKPSPKAFDIFYMEFQTVVPPGTFGFALDLAFFSAHYPEYNASDYNDMAIVWAESEAYVGNVAYLRNGNKFRPMSLPDLVTAGWFPYDGALAPELEGTGYDGADAMQGGASRWMTLEAPAAPGEALTVAIAILDIGDYFRDSALLLDHWRWSCAGCDPSTTCGLRLAD